MGKFINRVDARYGKLLVIAATQSRGGGGSVVWRCICDCGNEALVSGSALHSGSTKSCGCLFIETARQKGLAKRTHGMTATPTYRAWSGAKDRCTNAKNKKYHLYGGRGISICPQWERFECFFADMGIAPLGESLDRIDVDGNYEPGNCRWATQEDQQNNRRNNVIIEYAGEKMTMANYCKKHGLNSDKVQQRLKRGYTVEEAIKP